MSYLQLTARLAWAREGDGAKPSRPCLALRFSGKRISCSFWCSHGELGCSWIVPGWREYSNNQAHRRCWRGFLPEPRNVSIQYHFYSASWVTFLHLVIEGKTSSMPTSAHSSCQSFRLLTREPINLPYSAFMHVFHSFFQRGEPGLQPIFWPRSANARLTGMSASYWKSKSRKYLFGADPAWGGTAIARLNFNTHYPVSAWFICTYFW